MSPRASNGARAVSKEALLAAVERLADALRREIVRPTS